jgi:hypothetical protein
MVISTSGLSCLAGTRNGLLHYSRFHLLINVCGTGYYLGRDIICGRVFYFHVEHYCLGNMLASATVTGLPGGLMPGMIGLTKAS